MYPLVEISLFIHTFRRYLWYPHFSPYTALLFNACSINIVRPKYTTTYSVFNTELQFSTLAGTTLIGCFDLKQTLIQDELLGYENLEGPSETGKPLRHVVNVNISNVAAKCYFIRARYYNRYLREANHYNPGQSRTTIVSTLHTIR